jgi:hypothetical protein
MEEIIEKKVPQMGRPKKEIAEGRTRFTTTLQPALIKWLKIQAAQNNGSVADILENAINAYKYEKEKNL